MSYIDIFPALEKDRVLDLLIGRLTVSAASHRQGLESASSPRFLAMPGQTPASLTLCAFEYAPC
jgi:hypothetical protein